MHAHYNLLTSIVCLLVLEFGQEDYLVELVSFVLGVQVSFLSFSFLIIVRKCMFV